MRKHERLIALLLIVVLAYSGFRFIGATVAGSLGLGTESDGSSPADRYVSKTIEHDGVKYFPKQDMETFLLIGVDEEGPVQAREYYESGGMADAIMVIQFDKASETVDVISLNRDTMTDVPVIGIDGKPAGTIRAQLAASHAYGDGLHESCENTVKAVSNLLLDTEIDHYMALNMDGIRILNDAVGGVTVTVEDDFSAVDSDITMGEVTLTGDQALTFIRARKDVGTQLNVNRMERQQEYMENFFQSLKDVMAKDQSGTLVVDTFEELSPYMVTDCSLTVFSSMMEYYSDYQLGQLLVPEGENMKGEKYMEFYLDEESFQELVLDTFFVIKE